MRVLAREDSAKTAPWFLRWFPVFAALLFLSLLLPKLGEGTLYHNDELFTAERAREMSVRGDFSSITFNFQPAFQKPPLQYWATALCLRAFPQHREFAARLPATLLGALGLVAVGWAGRRCLAPGSKTALASVVALGLYGPFIHHSRHALLDPGAALLLLVVLVSCHLAREQHQWWAVAGVATVLGAAQKAPFGLAAWGLVLLLRWQRGELPPPGVRWLAVSLGAALVLVVAWPAWQVARFGLSSVLAVAERQGWDLAGPRSTGFEPWLYWWWLTRDWILLGALAPVAVVVAAIGRVRVFPTRWTSGLSGLLDSLFLREIGWVCLVFGSVIACLPHRTERYLVLIAPLLALISVEFVAGLLHTLPIALRRVRPDWALAAVIACAAPTAWFHYSKPGRTRADLLAPAHALGRAVRILDVKSKLGEAPTNSSRVFADLDSDPSFHTLGFLLFYGELPCRIQSLPHEDAARLSTLFATGDDRDTLVLCRRRDELESATLAGAEVVAGGASENSWTLFRLALKPTMARKADASPWLRRDGVGR